MSEKLQDGGLLLSPPSLSQSTYAYASPSVRYCFLGFIALVSVSLDLGLKMDQVLDKMAVGCLTRVRFARKHQRLKTTFRSQETLSHFMPESDALEVPAYQSSTIANCVGQSVH